MAGVVRHQGQRGHHFIVPLTFPVGQEGDKGGGQGGGRLIESLWGHYDQLVLAVKYIMPTAISDSDKK